jgi:hypothetical protein
MADDCLAAKFARLPVVLAGGLGDRVEGCKAAKHFCEGGSRLKKI